MTDKPAEPTTPASSTSRDDGHQPTRTPAELAAQLPALVASDDISLIYDEDTTDLLSRVPPAEAIDTRVYTVVAELLAFLQELEESCPPPDPARPEIPAAKS